MVRPVATLALLLATCARPTPSAPPLVAAAPPPIAVTPDDDGDGFLASVDRCPRDPGGEPDGCPIPDSDGDGRLDPHDRCVHIAETVNGILDDDGCPDVLPPRGCSRVDGSPRPAYFGPAPSLPPALEILASPLPDVPRLDGAGVVVLPAVTDERGFLPAAPLRLPVLAEDREFRDLERLVAAGGFADVADADPAEFIQLANHVDPAAPDWQLTAELGPCPWQPAHKLARIRLQAPPPLPPPAPRQIVLLVETGRSTAAAWPSIHAALHDLATTHLRAGDRVAVITYGADARVVVPATDDRAALLAGLATLATPSLQPATDGRALALSLAAIDPRRPGPRALVIVGRDDPTRLAAQNLAALDARTAVHLVVTDETPAALDDWTPALRHGATVHRARSFHAIRRALARAVHGVPTHVVDLELIPTAAVRRLRWIGGDDPHVLCDGPRIAGTGDLDPGEAVTLLVELDVAAARERLATIVVRATDGAAIRQVDLLPAAASPTLAMQVARVAAELALLLRTTGDRPAIPDIFSAGGVRRLAALERATASLIPRDPSGAAARLHAVIAGLRRTLPHARRYLLAERALFDREHVVRRYAAEIRRHAAAERAAPARPSAYFAAATTPTPAAVRQIVAMAGFMRDHLDMRWQLVGHCDDLEAADPPACAAIATKRAEVVRDRLVLRGVSASLLRVRLATADEREPAFEAFGRAQQRRVDFRPVFDP